MIKDPVFAYARLNARLMPIDRGERFEDPLDGALRKQGWGSVTGGGTMQSKAGEIDYCGIDLDLLNLPESVPFVCDFLTKAGAPKRSVLEYSDNGVECKAPFGRLEGLAIYLNGSELPKKVYQECDINVVCERVEALLGDRGDRWSHWQGPTETALYYYGDCFDTMRRLIADFVAEYPLCARCRIVQIA